MEPCIYELYKKSFSLILSSSLQWSNVLAEPIGLLGKMAKLWANTGTSQGSCGGGLERPSDIEMQNVSVGACLQIQQFPVRKPWKNLKGKVNCQFFKHFNNIYGFKML